LSATFASSTGRLDLLKRISANRKIFESGLKRSDLLLRRRKIQTVQCDQECIKEVLTSYESEKRFESMSKKLGTKITLAVIVFGIAFLDSSYSPLNSVHSFMSAAFILAVIFFGEELFDWLKRK
jgi:hypothetical protein